MTMKTPDLASIISPAPAPADVLPEDTKPAPDDSKEPVVWADDVSPFTGAEVRKLLSELESHREALKRQGKTRVFDELMKLARDGGARHLAFAVTLDDYFPYPSPKDSWVCEAYETDDPISEPIAGGKGRSGEEALRGCVVGLAVKK